MAKSKKQKPQKHFIGLVVDARGNSIFLSSSLAKDANDVYEEMEGNWDSALMVLTPENARKLGEKLIEVSKTTIPLPLAIAKVEPRPNFED